MANKVVGFSIEIKGQNNIKTTTELIGLLNKQLLDLNSNISTFESSASAMGKELKGSFAVFKKGNEVVKEMGKEFSETTSSIDEAAKELGSIDKSIKKSEESYQTLIDRNKELKKLLAEAPREGTAAFEDQKEEIEKLTKEYADNDKAIKQWRKNLKKGNAETKATTGQINKLKERQKELKDEYNNLTAAQQKGLFGQGAKIRRELKKTNNEIKRLNDRVRASSNLGKTLTRTFTKLFIGRSVLSGAANVIRKTVEGLQTLVEESDNTNEAFQKLETSGGRFNATLTSIGTGFLENFGGGISKIIDNISFSFNQVAGALTSAAQSGGIFGTVLQTIGSFFLDFPAIIGGVIEVIGEFRNRFVNTFTEISLQAQRVFANVKRIGTALTGGDTAEIDRRLAQINQRLTENVIAARTIGEAYQAGFDATIKAQEEFNKNADIEVEQQKKLAEAAKRRESASKAAAAAEKKRLEDLARQRNELLEQIRNESSIRISIINKLGNELRQAEIENIKDITEQSIAKENERFMLETKARTDNFKERLKQVDDQRERLVSLFGKTSKELIDFEKSTNIELKGIQAVNDRIAEEQEQTHQNNLMKIRQKAAKEEKEELEKDIENVLSITQKGIQEEEAAIAEARAKRLKQQKQDSEDKKKQFSETLAFIQQSSDVVFDAISKFTEIANNAETARLNSAIANRETSINNLNEQLENATGLQKLFLEEQVKNERKALEEEQKQREAAEKQRVKEAQEIALVQAIINGALAITRAFSDLGPIAGAIAAVGVAAGIAAQIAIIGNQKFQEGGEIVGPSHEKGGVPFSVAGRGGFEAEGGEIIFSRASVSHFGKANLLRMNKEGNRKGKRFADGGLVGAPISAPNVGSSSSDNSTIELIRSFDRRTAAIENVVSDISVTLDLNNLQETQDNDNNLRAITTFG